MDILWNNAKFIAPPINTYKCVDKTIDTPRLHVILSDALSMLENQQILHREAAIVSRLVYNMSRKFRHDIGHSYVRRTNIALLKYLNLNYDDHLRHLLDVVPENFSEDYVYVPTKQMFQFFLIRTQTFGKILCRLNLCSKRAALFYFERLKRGDSAWLSVMPYSVLSRIWLLSKKLLKSVCKWYNQLVPFLNKLKIVGLPIIPDKYEFPKDLSVWLNIEELETQSSHFWKSSNILSQLSYSVPQEDLNEDNIEESTNTVHYEISQFVQKNLSLNISEDFGEKISREEFFINLKNKPMKCLEEGLSTLKTNQIKKYNNDTNVNISLPCSKTKKSISESSHNIHSVKCVKSLKAFLKVENHLRQLNQDSALTKNIGVIQWEAIKKSICKKMLKLLKKNPSSQVFSQTFQNLWISKCA